MQGSPLIAHSPLSSPSFNSYSSSEKLADIAARVVREIASEPLYHDSDIFPWNAPYDDPLNRHFQALNVAEENNDNNNNNKDQNDAAVEEEDGEENDHDDDFEFAVVWGEADASPISADEIFYNGQIRPIYPLFNTDLLSKEEQELSIARLSTATATATSKQTTTMRSPLKKLLDEGRVGGGGEAASCSSSSEADELDGISPSTYCVWAPRKAAAAAAAEDKDRCKKSRSTGSSKRWKLRDLVFRSNSDGKETFVFLAPAAASKSGDCREIENNKNNKKVQEVKGSVTVGRGIKDGDKRRSFLPHRHDLVGLFSNNVNGLNKNLHPF